MAFGKVYCASVRRSVLEKSEDAASAPDRVLDGNSEPEMAFATLEDVKRVGEELVTFVVGRVLENRREDLAVLERDVTKLEAIRAPFALRMSYDDAVKKLQAKGSEIQWGGDFGNTDETLLTDDLDRPVIVEKFPTEIKAFYFSSLDAERS